MEASLRQLDSLVALYPRLILLLVCLTSLAFTLVEPTANVVEHLVILRNISIFGRYVDWLTRDQLCGVCIYFVAWIL